MAERVSDERRHDYWRRQWERRVEFYSEENRVYGTLIDFVLNLQHYRTNRRLDNRANRIQPKGQQQYNLIRHKTALLVTTPLAIEARPVQPVTDAEPAIIVRRVIEQVIQNPLKRYRNVRHRKVLTGLAAGRGVVAIEYDWTSGGTVFRNADARRLFPTPGFLDIHDPRMPDLIEQVPMRLSQVRAMRAQGWRVPDDLKADNHDEDQQRRSGRDAHRIEMEDASANASAFGEGDEDGIVTVLRCFSRHDPFRQTRSARSPVPRDLPEDRWYWDLGGGERVLVSDSPEPPAPMARLVTMDEDERELLRYPDGYLCVVAPHYGGKKPLWESGWLPEAVNPEVRLRSFPFSEFCPYLHPLQRAGLADGELTHSLQVIDNASWRAAWEQMRQANSIMAAPFGALFTADGRAFEPDDRPFQMAWFKDAMASERIKYFQGPGMNPAMPAFRSILSQQWAYIGTGDIAMPAERSRDVAVGAIQAMQQMGDLPVQLHRQVLNDDEAIEYGIVLDYERAYRSDAELVQWVTDSGELASARVRGADLVDANVQITAAPDWRALDADRIQAIAQFVGQMQSAPELMAAMAPLAGIPPEGAQAIQRAVAKMQAQPPGTNGSRPAARGPAQPVR